MATFFWTSFLALTIRRELNYDDLLATEDKTHRLNFLFHIVSWGIPLIAGVFLAVNPHFLLVNNGGWFVIFVLLKSYICERCSTRQIYEWIFWFTPLLIAVILNVILYFLIIRQINRTYRSFSTESSYVATIQRRIR